jgi:TIR domain-containing protein
MRCPWFRVAHDFAQVNQSGITHDVFISHAYKDKGIAQAICEKLESAQVRCWIAERDISAGEDWTEATRNAIGSSRVVVLVLSENANAAPHIEREIAHAFYTRRIIIPLRLTNTLPRRDFLFYIGNVPCFEVSAEQHLEALTTRINGMVRARAVTREVMPPHNATKTSTTLNFSNSWIGALRASHYRTLEILKGIAIAASLFAVVWLFWFVRRQTKHEAPLAEGHLHSRYSGPSVSPDAMPQGAGDAALSKSPTYTYTRFGLWVNPNTGPTPSVQQGLRDPRSSAPAGPSANASASPQSDVAPNAVGDAESLTTQASINGKSMQEEPTRIVNRRASHRAKSRPKAHNVRGRAPEELRFGERLRALWRQILARTKE